MMMRKIVATPRECPCGFWDCENAKKLGWCEGESNVALPPVARMSPKELTTEAKYWKEHPSYNQESWVVSRVKTIEIELRRRS